MGCTIPGARTAIPARVEQASSWFADRRVEVHGPQACTGVTEGLDEHGFLLVRTASGLVTVQTGGIRAAEIEAKKKMLLASGCGKYEYGAGALPARCGADFRRRDTAVAAKTD